jgi:hypothetical protein
MKTKSIKYPYYWLALTLCISLSANAQKLPNVQPAGVYAPANVKIDGKAAEWNNQFQAYNKSTSIFYTMANNNDNLYLTVQATPYMIIDKILSGGITLTITSANNKTIPPVSITSPILPRSGRAPIVVRLRDGGALTDAELTTLNNGLTSNFKEIGINGIKAIAEPYISIYNDNGIKASAALDINKAYNYEFAIPIKYITQFLGEGGTFNYNIKLSGEKMNNPNTIVVVGGNALNGPAPSADPYMELFSPTDFSGTYTLAKK